MENCLSNSVSFSKSKLVVSSVLRRNYLKKLAILVLTALMGLSVNAANNVTVSDGTANGTYLTLNAAITQINLATLSSSNNVVITIGGTGTTGETGVTLNGQSWSSFKIYPTTTSVVVTGSISGGALLALNGTTNVTIDGRVNGSGASQNLSIINSSASNTSLTSTIMFENSAASNYLQYCTVEGSSTATSGGVIMFVTATSGANNTNTIQYCNLTNAGTRPYNVIYASDASTLGNTITYNNIYNFTNPSAASYGINIGGTASTWSITNNSFWESSPPVLGEFGYYCIYISSTTGTGFNVSSNYIGGSASAIGSGISGTWTMTGLNLTNGTLIYFSFIPIYMVVGNSTASTVNGNVISGINIFSQSGGGIPGIFIGINIGNGSTPTYGGSVTVSNNTIGATSGTGSITINSATLGYVEGIYAYSSGTINITSNNIGSINTGGTAGVGYELFGINVVNSTGAVTVSSNTIGSTTTPNSITEGTAISTGLCDFWGIYVGSTGAVSIGSTSGTGNTIENCTVYGTGGTIPFTGIENNGTAAAGLTINYNTLTGNTLAGTGATEVFYGIWNAAATSTINMNNNLISSNTFSNAASYTGTVDLFLNSTAGAASSLSISSNTIGGTPGNGIIFSGLPCTGTINIINNTASPLSCNINSNVFSNLALNSTGTIYMITNSYTTPANGYKSIQSNQITGTFQVTATGANAFYGYYDNGSSPATSTINISANNFSNISIPATNTVAFYGIDMANQTNTPFFTVSSNTINNISCGTGTVYGINLTGGATGCSHNNSIYSNTIGNITTGNTASSTSIYGMYVNVQPAATYAANIYSNVVNTITSPAVPNISEAVYGLAVASPAPTNNIYQNQIYNITTSGESNTTDYGLYVSAGTTNYIYDNVISNIGATGSSIAPAVSGIYLATGTTNDVYFNSIYLNASSPFPGFGSAGIYWVPSTLTLNLINNIIINNSTPGLGSGNTVALQFSAATFTKYSGKNNNYYAGNPGAQNLIYYDPTNTAIKCLSNFTSLTANETGPISENTPFDNASSNVLTITSQKSYCYHTGNNSISYNDFNNNSRNNPPDIGAYEDITGTPSVTTPTATAVSPSACTGSLVLSLSNYLPSSTIQWFSNTSSSTTGGTSLGTGLPSPYIITQAPNTILYYYANVTGTGTCSGTGYSGYTGYSTVTSAVTTNATTTATAGGSQTICTSGTVTVSGASATPGGATISWTKSANAGGSLTNTSGLTPTYSPVTADAGQTITLTMTVTNSTCTATAYYTVIVTSCNISVSGSNNANGNYPSLSGAGGAFAALNANSQLGKSITITINGSESNETGANQLSETAGNWTQLKIGEGSTSTAYTVSGNVNAPLIVLNGVSSVTIDGRAGGTGTLSATSSLIIANASTGSNASTIEFTGGSTNNIIQYSQVQGSSTNLTGGVIFFTSGANTSNTITNSNLTNYNNNRPYYLVYANDASTTGNTISNNNIYNFMPYYPAGGSTSTSFSGIYIGGTASGWSITGNSFYDGIYSAPLGAYSYFCIFINSTSGNGFTVTGNYIGGSSALCSGTWNNTTGSYSFCPIYINAGTTTSSNVNNNTIGGINLATSSGLTTAPGIFTGIYIAGGSVNIGGASTGSTGNTIGAASSPITFASSTSLGYIAGIYASSTGTLNIYNNNIGSISTNGTTATIGYTFYGIQTAGIMTGTNGLTTSNNTIGSTISPIQIGTSGYTTAVCTIYGISNAATPASTGTLSITNNMIQNCLANGTTAADAFSGILNSGTILLPLNITGNTIQNCTSAGTGAGTFTGISNTGIVGATLNINNNTLSGNTLGGTGTYLGFSNTGTGSGTPTVNMNNNAFNSTTISNASYSGSVYIFYAPLAATCTTLSMSSNTISGINFASGSNVSGTFYGIAALGGTPMTCTVNSNNFNNLSLNTTGMIYLIYNSYIAPAGGTKIIQNNYITGSFTRTAASAVNFYCYLDASASNASSSRNISGNNFSNIYLNGTINAVNYGIESYSNTSNSFTFANNTINNFYSNAGTKILVTQLNGFGGTSSSPSQIYNNTISNVTNNSSVWALYPYITGTYLNIYNNTVSNITATAGAIYGLSLGSNGTMNAYNNNINSLSGVNIPVYGIIIQTGASSIDNIYQNQIYNINATGASGTAWGIYVQTSTTNTIYNNFISSISATANTTNTAAAGLYLTAGTNNVYYNTIYMNGNYTGAGFGTYGIYNSSTAATPCLTLNNNIIINNSTSSVSGYIGALFLGSSSNTYYSSTSNNNNFYAGTPSQYNLIANINNTSFDECLNTFQGFNSPSDGNSITENTPFVDEPSNLNISSSAGQTYCYQGGAPISGYTTDYYGNPRNSSTPDIGADEGVSMQPSVSTPIAAATPNPLCSGTNTTLSLSNYNGTIQWYANSSLIAGGTTNPYTTTGGITGTTNYYAIVTGAGCTGTGENNGQSNTVIVTLNTGSGSISSLNSTSATSPCIGSASTVTVALPSSPGNGTYTVTYNLTSPNYATGLTASMTVSGTSGTFTIPASALLSSGITTVTITNICSTAISSNNMATFTVYNNPAANAGIAQTICSGYSTTIGSTAVVGNTYSWSPATGLSSSTVSNPTASPTVTTNYTLTETNTCSSKSNSVLITVGSSQTATTVQVGTGQTYTTLYSAFNAINTGVITGAITLQITSSTTETATCQLNASGTGGACYSQVTIYPYFTGTPPASGWIIFGNNIAGSLITLNGANNVTINGSNGGTATGSSSSTPYLTLENTNVSTSGATITFQSNGLTSATNNTIEYCRIRGSSIATTQAGVIFFNGASAAANSNNTINYCNLTSVYNATGGVRPYNMIYCNDASTNNIIENNNIYNFFSAGATSYGINYAGTGIATTTPVWTIKGNSFYDTLPTFGPTVASLSYYNIYLNNTSGNGFTVTGNYIGGNNSALTTPGISGTWLMTATGQIFYFYGIYLNAVTISPSTVTNNTISGLSISTKGVAGTSGTPSTYTFLGIWVAGGAVNIGGTSPGVTGNIIGSPSNPISIYTLTTTGSYIAGIFSTSTGNVNIYNNSISSISTSGANGMGYTFNGIQTAGTMTGTNGLTISNNTIGSLTGPISMGTSATTTACNVFGINNAAIPLATLGSLSITNNVIQNCASNGTTVVDALTGIVNSATTNSISWAITGNTIQNNISLATGASTFTGISNTGTLTGATLNLNNNTFSGNTLGGTGAYMAISSTGTATAATITSVSVSSNTINSGTLLAASGTVTLLNNTSSSTSLYLNSNNIGASTSNGIIFATSSTCSTNLYGISNTGTPTICNISNNTFNNLSLNIAGTTLSYGLLYFINNNYTEPTNGSIAIQNNTISSITRTATSGTMSGYTYCIYNNNGSANNANTTVNISGNNLTNMNLNLNAGAFYGIISYNNTSGPQANYTPTLIYNNTISGISRSAGSSAYGIYLGYGGGTASTPSLIYNNTISNNSCTNSGIYGIYVYYSVYDNVYNNNIYNNSTSGAKANEGIIYNYPVQSYQTANIYNNNIYNLNSQNDAIGIVLDYGPTVNCYSNNINTLNSSGGSSLTYGVAGILEFNVSQRQQGPDYIYNNTISGLSLTTASTSSSYLCYLYSTSCTTIPVSGIALSPGSTGSGGYTLFNYCYGNQISNLYCSATAAPQYAQVHGIDVWGGYSSYATFGSNYIYNNIISDLNAPTSTNANAVAGIYVDAINNLTGTSMTTNIYDNTIYLNANTGGTGFGSTGFYFNLATSPAISTLTLDNNIVINNSTFGTATALIFSSNTWSYYTGNNNNFYAGTPSTTNLIYYDPSNTNVECLSAYKTLMQGSHSQDANSITENTPFVNTTTLPYDFHISPGIPTQCYLAGISPNPSTPLVTITTDYYGNTRYTAPDNLGAVEGSLTSASGITAPVANASPGIICSGSSTTLTLSNGGTGYQWYSNSSNATTGGTLISGATTNPYTLTNVTATQYYYATIGSALCSGNAGTSNGAVQVTVVSPPTITLSNSPTAGTAELCFSSSAQTAYFNYSGTSGSPTTYTIAGGGPFTGITDAILPSSPIGVAVPATFPAGTYTTTLTVNAGSCSNSYPITLIIGPPSVSNFSITAAPPCAGSSSTVTVNSTSLGNGTYTVTYNLTGSNTADGNTSTMTISNNSSGQFTTSSLTNSGTTTITITSIAYNTSTTCTSTPGSPGNTVTITSITAPSAPAVTTPVYYCLNGSSSQLTATGSNLLWYTTSTGGTGSSTAPTPSTSSAGTTDYYVSQSISGCESPRAMIAVTINSPPVITSPSPATASTCSGTGTNIILQASEASTYAWSAGTITGGITGANNGSGSPINQTLTNPSNTTAGTVQYTVTPTTTNGSCPGSAYTITVTVNPVPTATAGGSQTICTSGTATVSGASATNYTSILWTSSSTHGTLSGNTTFTPTYTPGALDAGTTVTLTITATNSLLCTATATYTVIVSSGCNIQVSGSNGSDGNYASLTANDGAFAAINSNNQSGKNIVITVLGSEFYETGANSLTGAAGLWSTLKLGEGSTASAYTVSGNVNAPLIVLNSVSNVTIDGSSGGAGSLSSTTSLIIQNTNTGATASTIEFTGSASTNTIKYCQVQGSSTNTAGGVILFTSGANSSNTINTCNLTNYNGNIPNNMIYANDASTGNVIENNNIYAFINSNANSYGINYQGTASSGSGWTIQGNSFYDNTSPAPGAYSYYCIYINNTSLNNFTITGNFIGGSGALCSGTWTLSSGNGFNFSPVYLKVSTSGTASSIQNNTISGISISTSSNASTAPGIFTGISILGGTVNAGTITGNTIGTSGSPISITSSTSTAYIAGIYATSTGTVNIQNNNISSIGAAAGTAETGYSCYGINTAGALGNITISSNTINSIIISNQSGAVSNFYGISNSATGTISVTGNTIQNCINYPYAVSGSFTGILNTGITGSLNINNNTIASNAFYGGGVTNTPGSGGPFTEISNTASCTGTININSNNIASNTTVYGENYVSSYVTMINNSGAGSAASLSISSNTINGMTLNAVFNQTGIFYGIKSSCSPASSNINSNVFNNLTLYGESAASGTFYTIYTSGTVSGNSYINSNTISGINFNSSPPPPTFLSASDPFYGIYNSATALNSTINSNNFNNLSLNTTGAIYLIDNNNFPTVANSSKTVQNNYITTGCVCSTQTNVSSGAFYCYADEIAGSPASLTLNVSGNNFSNINMNSISTGNFYGIDISSGGTYPSITIYNNTINSLTCGTGAAYGISAGNFGTSSSSPSPVSYNTISNFTTASSAIYGLYISTPSEYVNAYNNTINNLSTTGTSGSVNGIYESMGTTNSYYNNQIYNLSSSGASGAAYGLYVYYTVGTNYIYNNLIYNITANSSNSSAAVAGIYLTGGTNYFYYNTIYLNGSFTAAGSSYGVIVIPTFSINASVVEDNIIINNIIPTGTGVSGVFYLTSTGQYSASSDYNNFYAGTPTANYHVIANINGTKYECLSNFQNIEGANTNDNNSISENTAFNLPTNLSITTSPTLCESHGIPVTSPISITSDGYGNLRWGAGGYAGNGLAPDIGAVEGNYTGVTATGTSGTNTIICSGYSTTITLNYAGYSGTIQWQQSNTGTSGWGTVSGGSGGTSAIYTTAPLTTNTYYRAQLQETNGSCVNTVYSLVAGISIILTPAVPSVTSPVTYCQNATASALTATGSNLLWYTTATGGTGNPTAPTPSTAIPGTTDYYVSQTGVNGCESPRAVIAVTVNPMPNPTISIFGTEGNPDCIGAVRIRYYTETGKSNYIWQVSGGNISSGNGTSEIQVTWNNSGIDTVSVNYTSGGCSASTKYLVTVYANANITLQPSPVTIVTGGNTSFSISSDGLGLTYQWQVSTNGGTTYTNITSAGSTPTYSGFTSNTLSLTGVVYPTNNGYLYRCTVIASSPCSSLLNSNGVLLTVTSIGTDGLWDGTLSTDWGTGGNWDDGIVPVSTTNVLIPSSAPYQPLLSGSGTCNNITINPRASLSVTGTLASEGNLQILSDATGTGAFTQSDAATVSITGTVTVQRYLSNLGYHYLASPIQGVECNELNGFGGMTYTGGGTWYDSNHPSAIVPYPNMWRIDEAHTHYLCPADYNSWYAPAKTEIMNPGVGYAINIATGAKTLSVSNTGSVLNAGKITASVSKEALSTNTIYNNDCLDQYGDLNGTGCVNVHSGPTNGWHLIGNPYPSPVDWNAVVKDATDPGVGANIGYGISYFKPTTQWTGVYGVYFYNGIFGTTSGAFAPSRYIPSMQSFFIQNGYTGAGNNTPVLTFINSDRTVTSLALNANFYRSSESGVMSSEYPNISLYGYKGSVSNIKDKVIIMFNAQNTDFGAGKLMNTDENVPNIYSKGLGLGLGSGEELSIQGISEFKNDMIIPLGFDVNTSGNYTINAEGINNFPAGTHIYLEDLIQKVTQDLTLNPSYSFAINKGDADNRFYLKFGQSLQTNVSSAEMFEVYSNENALVVNYNNPANTMAVLSILNILGQNVQELKIENGQLRINTNVAPGAYLIRLVTNDKVYVKKVYIQ